MDVRAYAQGIMDHGESRVKARCEGANWEGWDLVIGHGLIVRCNARDDRCPSVHLRPSFPNITSILILSSPSRVAESHLHSPTLQTPLGGSFCRVKPFAVSSPSTITPFLATLHSRPYTPESGRIGDSVDPAYLWTSLPSPPHHPPIKDSVWGAKEEFGSMHHPV